MTGIPILEVAIGLAFTYLLLALICSILTEWIARLRDSRARMLEAGIRQMLGEGTPPPKMAQQLAEVFKKVAPDPNMTDELYAHPLIKNLAPPGKQPSYVDARTFALAFQEVVQGKLGGAPGAVRLSGGARKTYAALQNARVAGAPPLEEIERWYESAMERVSGWYKRHTQSVVLALSFAVVFVTNADTFMIMRTLWSNPSLRAKMIEGAKVRAQRERPLETVEYTDPTNPKPTEPVKESTHDANTVTPEEEALLGQILGWAPEHAQLSGLVESGTPVPWIWLLHKLLGLGFSGFAVALGAPFWFDTLNKFMNIRSAGPKPKEKQK